jgi:uncharacterized protein (TIGR02646 family)
MIRLLKGALPQVLAENAERWTAALLERLHAGEEPSQTERTRYRHADIKAALVEETHGKCAYCESKLRHVTYGDVEHVTPKYLTPERTFEWANLTLACDICNTNKGTHTGVIDPYAAEPSEHLDFVGAMVLARPGSDPGISTEVTLQLNRPPLLERRAERMKMLARLLHVLSTTQEQAVKTALRHDIEVNETGTEREYAAMSRAYVNDQLARMDAQIRQQPEEVAS